MAELVDALDSKSSAARRAGSIPALGTIYLYHQVLNRLLTHVFQDIVGFLLSQAISQGTIRYQQKDGISVGTCKYQLLRYQH